MSDYQANSRRSFSPEFKLQVVLESAQRDTTIEAVCRKHTLTSSVVHRWREEFKKRAPDIFLDKRDPRRKSKSYGFPDGQSPDDLKKIIGELTVQNEILKKVQGLLSSR